MRDIASRAVALAIALCTVGIADCHHAEPDVAAPPLPGAAPTRPADRSSFRSTHLHVAALVPKAPVTLTSSDGKGLALASLSARAVLAGPLAFTEMHLTFVNPEPRTLEGTFAITLPQRASISRFAMRTGASWQEGEVVEKQRARASFEDFLHRKRDPALLEQAAGNQFSARVFPIPAGGTKEIVVSYAQELRGGEPYVLPLRGLPEVGRVELGATAEGANVSLAARREQTWAPDEDFVVDRAALAGSGRGDGLRSGDLALVRVRPQVDARPDHVTSAVVLFDTSASAALELDARARQLAEVVAKIATQTPEASLTVACFDQEVAETYSGPASGFGQADVDRLRARSALGASDLAQALAWARDRARATGARRVVLVSDGVATAGAVDRADLVRAAKSLGEGGVERLDVIASGGIRDDGVLAAMTRAGLARNGVVVDDGEGPETIARRLGSATRSGIAVDVRGAAWSYPHTLDGAQPGDEFLVYAQLSPREGAQGERPGVAVTVDGVQSAPLDLRPIERPLLDRAWAQARIASLLDREGERSDHERTRQEIIELSTSHRVLSPYTALLVLETEADYARFRIDRKALAEVLEVQGSRVVLTHRSDAVVAPGGPFKPSPPPGEAAQFGAIGALSTDGNAPVAPWGREKMARDASGADTSSATGHMFGETIGEAFGAGGLGLSGVGQGGGGEGIGLGSSAGAGQGAGASVGSGYGSGHGRLGGSHVARAPALRVGSTSVSGRVPPEVIQRIVRQNFGRFRACYEDALRVHPAVQGRVAIRFVIDRSGAVPTASDGGSDVGDPALVACVARAFERLSFPQPDGAPVTVVYPIVLSPEGGATPSTSGAVATGSPAPTSASPTEGRERTTDEPPLRGDPYSGRFADVMRALAAGDTKRALDLAWAWRDADAGDVLALVALGEALEASKDTATAARAYGSIIDLFPSSADLRRMAGERLERLAGEAPLSLSADDYAKAVADRPDHPSSHRMLAYALLKKRDYAGAFDAAAAGLAYHYPEGRYAGVDRILREDLGLVGAAWAAAEPARRDAILARVRSHGGTVETAPSLRFVLSWESDANDVDLHVRDADGGHAYYSRPKLPSGGELYADVTTGYGPECFAIDAPPERRSSRYSLQVHYYSRGPMGYGMGKVEIVDHDGRGGLKFDERPFVVMNDHAFVDLGDY
jgi:hypothetical protein